MAESKRKEARERSRLITILLVLVALLPGLWIGGAVAWRALHPQSATPIAAAGQDRISVAPGPDSGEQAAVYAAYLEGNAKGGNLSVSILNHTTCSFKPCTPGPEFPEPDAALRATLGGVNGSSSAIQNLPETAGLHATMVSDLKARPLRTFSAVAFNLAKTEALFYTEDLCPLCGSAEFVLMRKEKSQWKIAARHRTWVS